MAFLPLQAFFEVDSDPIEDLLTIYALLEVTQQAAFRAGLAIALAQTEYDLEHVAVLEALLQVALEVGAWEVIPVITDKQRMNWITSNVPDDELIDAFIRTLVSLAVNAGPTEQTARATEALLDLARAPRLPDEYAEPVLVSLCRMRPTVAWDNLAELRPKLDNLLRRTTNDADEAERIRRRGRVVESMRGVIGAKNFVAAIRVAHEAGVPPERDWWLSTALALADPRQWMALLTPNEPERPGSSQTEVTDELSDRHKRDSRVVRAASADPSATRRKLHGLFPALRAGDLPVFGEA